MNQKKFYIKIIGFQGPKENINKNIYYFDIEMKLNKNEQSYTKFGILIFNS